MSRFEAPLSAAWGLAFILVTVGLCGGALIFSPRAGSAPSVPVSFALGPPCHDEKLELDRARSLLAVFESITWERRYEIVNGLADCVSTAANEQKCSGVMNGRPVAYLCAWDHCEWLVKP